MRSRLGWILRQRAMQTARAASNFAPVERHGFLTAASTYLNPEH